MPGLDDNVPVVVLSTSHQLKPSYANKFRAAVVKEIMSTAMNEFFANKKQYESFQVQRWTSDLCEDIKSRLKNLNYGRYKYVVQVVLGEQRGEGVMMATKCFWDSETDNYASQVFSNDNYFAVAVAYGAYYY